MNSITSVALTVILSSTGAFCFPSHAGAAPTRSSSNKVYVSIGGQLRSFSPAANEDGLLMQSEVAQIVSETHLRFAGALQRIVRIAVDVREWENSGIIAIAVEEKVDSGSLGYRFLIRAMVQEAAPR